MPNSWFLLFGLLSYNKIISFYQNAIKNKLIIEKHICGHIADTKCETETLKILFINL